MKQTPDTQLQTLTPTPHHADGVVNLLQTADTQLQTLSLTPHRSDGVVDLLQITDTHLFADKDADFLGIAPWHSARAVVDAVLENARELDTQPQDFILATGDLSQDQTPESYRHFSALMGELAPPIFWLPGNHDDGHLMQAELDAAGISSAKHLLCGQWQILLLDTHLDHETFGELSAALTTQSITCCWRCIIKVLRWAVLGWISIIYVTLAPCRPFYCSIKRQQWCCADMCIKGLISGSRASAILPAPPPAFNLSHCRMSLPSTAWHRAGVPYLCIPMAA